MDPISTATTALSMQASAKADTLAAKFLKNNADSDAAVAGLLEAASANLQKLAPTAPGVGGNLDVTV